MAAEVPNRADGRKAKPKQGDRVLIRTTITNAGPGHADNSQTEIRVDDELLGVVQTAAIPPGQAVEISIEWRTGQANGEHLITATADIDDAVRETNESNNTGRLTVEVRGNQVHNGDFEQPNETEDGPAGWTATSTGAGTASWNEEPAQPSGDEPGEPDEPAEPATNRSVSIRGTGRSVLLHGLPVWTSDAISVSPGQMLTVSVDVRTQGMSSAPTIGLAYLGTTGKVLQTVSVLTVPLQTDGFTTIEQLATVPLDATAVRIVLTGFSATDTKTRGTVTFDNVGLFAE